MLFNSIMSLVLNIYCTIYNIIWVQYIMEIGPDPLHENTFILTAPSCRHSDARNAVTTPVSKGHTAATQTQAKPISQSSTQWSHSSGAMVSSTHSLNLNWEWHCTAWQCMHSFTVCHLTLVAPLNKAKCGWSSMIRNTPRCGNSSGMDQCERTHYKRRCSKRMTWKSLWLSGQLGQRVFGCIRLGQDSSTTLDFISIECIACTWFWVRVFVVCQISFPALARHGSRGRQIRPDWLIEFVTGPRKR